jgi:hypothetical protein
VCPITSERRTPSNYDTELFFKGLPALSAADAAAADNLSVQINSIYLIEILRIREIQYVIV